MFYNANAPVPPQLYMTLIGCLHSHTGDYLIAQITLRNPGTTARQAEIKVGVRLPTEQASASSGPTVSIL